MKNIIKILSCALILGNLSSPASQAAAPVAGAKCVKYGQVKSYKGKNFTCIQSGKKLVWNKGVAIKLQSDATAKASASPTPIAAPSVSATPTPSAIAAKTIEEPLSDRRLTFENLLSNYKDIPSIAFENTQLLMQFNKDKKIAQTFTFRVAPGLTVDIAKYQEAIKKGNVFFANYQQPVSYLGILYTAKDMGWAKEVFDKETGYADHDDMVKAPFGGDPNANSGGANANTINNHGVTVFGYFKGYDTDPFINSMSMTVHEYVHQVQVAQFSPKRGDQGTQANETVPCWINEGQANYNGISIASYTFEDYLKSRDIQAHSLTLRNANVTGGQSELNKSQLTPEYISKYYDAMNITAGGSCISSSQYGLGYSIGMLTVEALSSIKGASSMMNLLQKLGLGKTFEQSFEEVYGEKWTGVKITLAQLVSKELQEILG